MRDGSLEQGEGRRHSRAAVSGHGHSGHAHEHGHDETSEDPEAHRVALVRGAAEGRVVFLDTQSGVAGDMTIAALVDLGVPFELVRDVTARLGLDGVECRLSAGYAGAVGASSFRVLCHSQQPERDYAGIDALLRRAPLSPPVRELSRLVFRTLAEAEARVHRIPVERVHFHEVGAVDALVDIVGAATCFEHLGGTVLCTPLPLGRGRVACQHGVLPLPAPATVECLRGVPTYDAGIDAELVTPTGAAIVKTVVKEFCRWPALAPDRVGWGKGTKQLPDRPNALRAILGDPATHATRSVADYVVIEANVDDMTGELVGHALEALLAAGALDAWAVPVTMKKGRPGLTVCALGTTAAADGLSEVMLRETTSIGVRRLVASRIERPRRTLRVTTEYGPIDVKVSEGLGGPAQIKPEFSQCVDASRKFAVPVRQVLQAALRAALGAIGA